MNITENAHFLRLRASSIGVTHYQDNDVDFRELMSSPNELKIIYNDTLVDTIPIYRRMQIHYANLRPEQDSDEDGIINRLDPNPRVPEPIIRRSDVNIAVYYLTGWQNQRQGKNDWAVGAPVEPLFGTYDSSDPDAVDRHIKSAVEHGVNIFIMPYTKAKSRWETAFEDGLLRARYLPQIKIGLMLNLDPWLPGNPYGNDPSKCTEVALETVTYSSENYFDLPQYFTINNKPAMLQYHAHNLHDDVLEREGFASLIGLIRETAAIEGHDLFLIGDVMDTGVDEPERADHLIQQFDAVSSYNMINAGEGWDFDESGNYIKPYDSMVTGYIELTEWWSRQATLNARGFIPPLCPGFSTRYLYDLGIVDTVTERTEPSPEKFKTMCESIIPYIDPDLNMVIVEAWNEFHEGSVIEPTVEYGYSYLETLYDAFSLQQTAT